MRILSLVIVSFLLASPLLAQDNEEPQLGKSRGTKVGIGIALSPGGIILLDNNDLTSVLPMSLRVPVNISTVKLEPELGIYSFSDKIESNNETSESSGTLLKGGIGFYYNAILSSEASVYVGPKVGITKLSTVSEFGGSVIVDEATVTQEMDRTDIFFGAMVGGEYFFSTRFSVGAEAGFEYVSRGNETRTATPDTNPSPDPTTSGSELQTKSALTARFYF
jgi:hypothetical protein